jgi:hypothetical protein
VKKFIFPFFVLFSIPCLLFSQVDTVGNFLISKENDLIKIVSVETTETHTLSHSNPTIDYHDFDEDGLFELLIISEDLSGTIPNYKLYVYRLGNIIELIDSIKSGVKKPELIFSEESGLTILAIGFSSFDLFNSLPNFDLFFSPLKILFFNGENFETDFEDCYDILLKENEEIFSFITEILQDFGKNCKTSKLLQSAFAATYVNYFNAGEFAMADHLIDTYYFCEDKKEFILLIKNTLLERP